MFRLLGTITKEQALHLLAKGFVDAIEQSEEDVTYELVTRELKHSGEVRDVCSHLDMIARAY